MMDWDSLEWKPVDTAPYQKTVWVRNPVMEKPCLATRGYVHNGAVHPDSTFFTTVYTPDQFWATMPGQLACPTEWAEYVEEEQ